MVKSGPSAPLMSLTAYVVGLIYHQFYLWAKRTPDAVHDQSVRNPLLCFMFQDQTNQSQLDLVILGSKVLFIILHCKSFRKGWLHFSRMRYLMEVKYYYNLVTQLLTINYSNTFNPRPQSDLFTWRWSLVSKASSALFGNIHCLVKIIEGLAEGGVGRKLLLFN